MVISCPSMLSCSTLLCFVADRVDNLIVGMSFHAHAISVGYCLDTSLVNALINLYMNYDDLEAGHLLFNSMIYKDVVSWNVLMTGFRNHKFDKEVMILFNQMILYGERPNSTTLLNILSICTSQKLGKSIHGYAVRNFSFLEDSLLLFHSSSSSSSSSSLLSPPPPPPPLLL